MATQAGVTQVRFNTQVRVFALLATLFLLWPAVALAQDSTAAPIEVQLAVDRITLDRGESCQAVLVLRNTMPYTLTGVSARLQGTSFQVVSSSDLPDILAPYSSVQAEYTLKSQSDGTYNVVFAIQYAWDDTDTGAAHRRLETTSVEKIVVTSLAGFNWPAYLIPLLIGSVLGWVGSLSGSFAAHWLKQRNDDKEQREQALGITLPVLQTARKGVQDREQVSFGLWEDAIVKGKLYSALHKLGRKIGEPGLSRRLAELSIALADYNARLTGNLTDARVVALEKELDELIKILEKVG